MITNGHNDSFSSDDELPLNLHGASDPNNSYKSLCSRKKVECEFCDRSFKTRYQALIHNANHIIIPLLNQTVSECEHCRFCFTSSVDLERHISKVHSTPVTLEESQKKRVKMRNRIQFEEDDLISLPELLTDLTNGCSVTLNRSLSKEIIDTLDEKFNLGFEERIKNAQRNRHIRRNSVNFNWINSYKEFVNSMTENVLNDLPFNTSVHYEELRRPVPVRCKYCKEMFKDRYDLVVHQVCHVRINHRRVYTRTPPKKKLDIQKISFSTPTPPIRTDCLIRICDLCYRFLKPKTHLRYVRKGNVSQPGKRSQCNMCSRKFFELILVERTKLVYRRREKGHRKGLTNDQRLKNIRHRLKAANKVLTRSWCFICPVNNTSSSPQTSTSLIFCLFV